MSLAVVHFDAGDATCTCSYFAQHEGPSVRRRMRCAYHLFRDLVIARQYGIEYDEGWVALRMRKEAENA